MVGTEVLEELKDTHYTNAPYIEKKTDQEEGCTNQNKTFLISSKLSPQVVIMSELNNRIDETMCEMEHFVGATVSGPSLAHGDGSVSANQRLRMLRPDQSESS